MGIFMAAGLWSAIAAAASSSVDVTAVHLTTQGVRTELVLSLSTSTQHTLFSLSDPNRIVIDVDGAHLSAPLPSGVGVVTSLRSAAHDGTLRLVMDLNTRAMPQSFIRQGASGPELVVDLTAPGVASAPAATIAVSAPAPVSVPAPVIPRHGRDIVVAVDAGHGGKDPGAHGPKGAYEKNVTLAIAKKLAALIDQQPGMKAVLTRDSDVYVPLMDRFIRAQHANADLFVSIHCDAARDKSVDGATVYVLSEHGATTEHAKFLEREENDPVLVGGVHLAGLSPQVKSVVVDMSQSAVMGMSFDVGGSVAKQLAAIGAMHKYSVQQAGFLVLKAPDVPSMLIETNYITNPHTAKLLMSSDYQQHLAQAIFTGVNDYFGHYPPPDTQYAVLKQQHDGRTSSMLASGVGIGPNK